MHGHEVLCGEANAVGLQEVDQGRSLDGQVLQNADDGLDDAKGYLGRLRDRHACSPDGASG